MGFTFRKRKNGLNVSISSRGIRISRSGKIGNTSVNMGTYIGGTHDGLSTARITTAKDGLQYRKDFTLSKSSKAKASSFNKSPNVKPKPYNGEVIDYTPHFLPNEPVRTFKTTEEPKRPIRDFIEDNEFLSFFYHIALALGVILWFAFLLTTHVLAMNYFPSYVEFLSDKGTLFATVFLILFFAGIPPIYSERSRLEVKFGGLIIWVEAALLTIFGMIAVMGVWELLTYIYGIVFN